MNSNDNANNAMIQENHYDDFSYFPNLLRKQ